MSQLIFTKAAALRILQAQAIAARCVEAIRVYKGAVQVTYLTKNGRCSTFLSKTAFYSDFISFRQEGAKSVAVQRWSAGSYQNHFRCHSGNSENIHTVRLIQCSPDCSCPDWQKQQEELSKAAVGCKHILATLNHVGGYSSLAEYMDAMEQKARADLFGGGWDEPATVETKPTVIAALGAVVAPNPRKTKPAPDPFGGFGI